MRHRIFHKNKTATLRRLTLRASALTVALTLAACFGGDQVNISVTPSTVNIGQSAKLSWSSSHSIASNCFASGAWSGGQAGGGTEIITPMASGTYVYTLTCGSVSGSATLTVPPGTVSVLAGQLQSPGYADGTGTAAAFKGPTGLAADSAGNIYVADTTNSLIRKVTPAGVVTTLAGTVGVSGTTNGTGTAASFNLPTGIVVDSNGNLFVSDAGDDTIREISPAGGVTTFAGTANLAGSTNGTGTAASFNAPTGLAIDSANNLYVADTGNDTIRMITPAGVVTTIAGVANSPGATDTGTNVAATFSHPEGIAVSSSGVVYVADTINETIRQITLSGGAGTVTTIAGIAGSTGSADGVGTATDAADLNESTYTLATFDSPLGISVDSLGNLYIADSGNHVIRELSPSGLVSTVAGIVGSSPVEPGTLPTSLDSMSGITIDSSGVLYISADSAVVKIVL